MPGQFILSAAYAVAPFAIVLGVAVFLRPHRSAFTARSVGLSLLLTSCLSVLPCLLPRPTSREVTLRVFDSARAPVPGAAVTYTAFGGKGSNFDGKGRTDSAGVFNLVLYPSEWGEITISASSGTAKVAYEPWPEIMVGGKRNGIRLIPAGDTSHLEPGIGYVIGRTVAADSEEVFDVILQQH